MTEECRRAIRTFSERCDFAIDRELYSEWVLLMALCQRENEAVSGSAPRSWGRPVYFALLVQPTAGCSAGDSGRGTEVDVTNDHCTQNIPRAALD